MEDKIKRIKLGSAVYITDETRNPATDALFTPDGGVKVDVYNHEGTKVLDAVSMTEVSTGNWAYSWQTTDPTHLKGMYKVITKATHLTKVSVKEDRKAFELY